MSTLPLLFAIALQSSHIGYFWSLPDWCPTSTESKETVGSDDFLRENQFALTASNAATFYGTMDAFDVRQYDFSYGSSVPTNKTVTSRGLDHHDTFVSYAERTQSVPCFGSEDLGVYASGRALDRYLNESSVNTFKEFAWCTNVYTDVGAGRGWFADYRAFGPASYFSGPGDAGGLAWDAFSQLHANDAVAQHAWWDDVFPSTTTFDAYLRSAYARGEPSAIATVSSKVLDLRPIEAVAQAIGVYDKVYYPIDRGDVIHTQTNVVTHGSVSYSAHGNIVYRVGLSGGSNPRTASLYLIGSGPLDVGSPEKKVDYSTYYAGCVAEAPRFRGGGVSVGAGVGAELQIGAGFCTPSQLASAIDTKARLGGVDPESLDLVYLALSSDPFSVTFVASTNGHEICRGTFSITPVIDYEDGPLPMVSHASVSAEYTTEDTVLPILSRNPTLYYPTYASDDTRFHALSSCVVAGGSSVPPISQDIDFESDYYPHEYDAIEYRGKTYEEVFSAAKALDNNDLVEKMWGKVDSICGTHNFSEPEIYTGLTSSDFHETVGNFTEFETRLDFHPGGGDFVVRRVPNPDPEAEYGWMYVTTNGTAIAGGGVISARLNVSGSIPEEIKERVERDNCAVDCKRVWIQDSDLTFDATGTISGGDLSTNELCFTHGDWPEERAKDAYADRKGCCGANGNDPVYRVRRSGFEGAFARCPNFQYARFPECTNVSDRAFAGAFEDCPVLREVDFGNLVTAGNAAFEKASRNATNGETYDFAKLETCGHNAFNQAFVNTRHTGGGYPELTVCGSNAFEEAWYNAATNFQMIGFPKLQKCGNEAFKKAFYRKFRHKTGNITELRFNELEKAGFGAFNEAFAYTDLADPDPFITLYDGVAYNSGGDGVATNDILICGYEAGYDDKTWRMGFKKGDQFVGVKTCAMTFTRKTPTKHKFIARARLGSSEHDYATMIANGWTVALQCEGSVVATTSRKQHQLSIVGTPSIEKEAHWGPGECYHIKHISGTVSRSCALPAEFFETTSYGGWRLHVTGRYNAGGTPKSYDDDYKYGGKSASFGENTVDIDIYYDSSKSLLFYPGTVATFTWTLPSPFGGNYSVQWSTTL